MPFNVNVNGTSTPHHVYVNQNGTAVPCKVYVNDAGTAKLVYTPKVLVDGYEDGSVAPYTGVGANEASVNTASAYADEDGDGTAYGLDIASGGASGLFYCTPQNVTTPPNGEWLPSGSEFEFRLNPQIDGNFIFYYAAAQDNSYYKYEVRCFPGSNSISIYADNNGSHAMVCEDTAVTWGAAEWYRVQVGYDTDGAGNHYLQLYDSTGTRLTNVSGTATYHSDGSWLTESSHKGWAYYSYGDEFYFDSLYKL